MSIQQTLYCAQIVDVSMFGLESTPNGTQRALCSLYATAGCNHIVICTLAFFIFANQKLAHLHIYRALKLPLSARFPFPCVYCVWPLWDFPYKSKTWVYCFKRIGCTIVVPFVQCMYIVQRPCITGQFMVAPWWRCHNTFPFFGPLAHCVACKGL